MNDKTVGIVIKENDAKENDVILTVYTKDFGKLSFYAKGLKKSTSKNAYACQMFDYSEFLLDYNDARDIQILKSASLKNEFVNIKGDYEKLGLASVMVEIIDKIAEDDMYDFLYAALDLLDRSQEMYTVFNIFLAQILKYVGLQPMVDGCVICGNTQNIETISLNDGGFVCHDCNSTLNIKKRDVAFLRNFRIINKASFEVYDKLTGQGFDDYNLAELLMEFLIMHSGLRVRSWRSVTSLHN